MRNKRPLNPALQWSIREKKDPNALHALFSSRESADAFLINTIPAYCAMGFFMDKKLEPSDFIVVLK